jgi:hypothetical protein
MAIISSVPNLVLGASLMARIRKGYLGISPEKNLLKYHIRKNPRYWAGLNGYILFTTAVTITIAVADY